MDCFPTCNKNLQKRETVTTTRTMNRLQTETRMLPITKSWPLPTNSAFVCRYLFIEEDHLKNHWRPHSTTAQLASCVAEPPLQELNRVQFFYREMLDSSEKTPEMHSKEKAQKWTLSLVFWGFFLSNYIQYFCDLGEVTMYECRQ